MEFKITTSQMLVILQVLSWIIFIGLCIDAGALIVNTCITLFVDGSRVENFWNGKEFLAGLYIADAGYFITVTGSMIIVAVLKATMFYLILKLFLQKKLTISRPFSTELKSFIINQGYLALGIGLFSHFGFNYARWLAKKHALPLDLQALHLGDGDVWLFMAVLLFVIAQVVKKGIEVQHENDLTI